MNEFDTIQNLWNNQTGSKPPYPKEIAEKAERRSLEIKRFHNWTIGVLTTWFIVLLVYFLWINYYGWNAFSVGLGLMGIILLIRVGVEMKSKKRFNAIKPYHTFINYSHELLSFYQWRKRIHYLLTPILYLAYVTGFIMLLPTLRFNLSKGFYIYVIISGAIVLTGLAYFIMKQIKKELKIITYLNDISALK